MNCLRMHEAVGTILAFSVATDELSDPETPSKL